MSARSSAVESTPVKRGRGRPPGKSKLPNYPKAKTPAGAKPPVKKRVLVYDNPLDKVYCIAREHLDGHIQILSPLEYEATDENGIKIGFVKLDKILADENGKLLICEFKTVESVQEIMQRGRDEGISDYDPAAINRAVAVPLSRVFDPLYSIFVSDDDDVVIDFRATYKGQGNSVETVVRDYLEYLNDEYEEAKRVHEKHYEDVVKPAANRFVKHKVKLMGPNS